MTEAEKKARRAALQQAFAGKTIQRIEAGSVNVWVFHFTDGTQQEIVAEQAVATPYGSIPGIFMEQEIANKA
jgi:hypothetical protein